ncbi:MAG: SEC-C metal-binding domain-containing protein [Defluviitaleaceae bacterium]|nr:SEC-C metal-binding domain-containing protein [Defluviitaleaceae bacterium]
MSIYESWIAQAYDKQGQTVPAHWNLYLPQEQRVYEDLLSNKRATLSGTVAELAQKYNMPVQSVLGFLDGINEALNKPFAPEELKALEESSQVDISFEFEGLYKKMVEFKADHLYNLELWDGVVTPQRQEELYKEQKNSGTFRKDPVPGRNEPCTCGSGKKYKKCCGV